jgi:hypothetical protein
MKLTDLEKLEKLVNEYVEENGVAPFADIRDKGEGELEIDMDTKFEEKLTSEVQNISETLGLYFTKIIQEMIEAQEASEETHETY